MLKKKTGQMPVKLCRVCQKRPTHPLYGPTCEDCYADTQSYLTRPFDSSVMYGSRTKTKNVFGEQALDESISILGLTVRVENFLSDNNILFIKDLVAKTREELLQIRGLGEEYVAETEKKLKGICLALRESQLQKS